MEYTYQSKVKTIEDLKKAFSKDAWDLALTIIRELIKRKVSFKDLVEGTKKPKAEKTELINHLKERFATLIAKLIMNSNNQVLNEVRTIIDSDFIGVSSFYNFYKNILSTLDQERPQLFGIGYYVYKVHIERSLFDEDRTFIIQTAVNVGGKQLISEKILDYLTTKSISDSDINVLLSSLNKNKLLVSLFSILFHRVLESKPSEEWQRLLGICKAILDHQIFFEAVQPLPVVFYATRNSLLTERLKDLKIRIEEKIDEERRQVIEHEVERVKALEKGVDEKIKDLKERIDELKRETEEKKFEYIAKNEMQNYIKDRKVRARAFYEAWKDEEIVRILGKLVDLRIFLEEASVPEGVTSIKRSETERRGIDWRDSLGLIDGILKVYKVSQLGKVGDIVNYDSKFHENLSGLKIGSDTVKLVRPGYIVLREDGQPKYVVQKAIVEEIQGGMP
jgi:hypothetical protein